MKLKKFENENIPEEIHEFYDDMSTKYLKSDYSYGKAEKGPIISEKIGRYKMKKDEIYLVEPNVELSYLLHCEEGRIKQDEIVLKYDKYVLLKELKDILEKYVDDVFETIDMEYIEDNKTIEDAKFMKNIITVSAAGILIACHIFGIRKVKKLFSKKAIYCKDKIPITYYIDDKMNYDITYITGEIKKKKVIPNVKEEDEIKIDTGEEFIGQKSTKDLKEQLAKILETSEKIKKMFEKKKEEKQEEKHEEKQVEAPVKQEQPQQPQDNSKILDELKEYIKKENNNTNNNHRLVNDNKEVDEILQKKFDNEYGDKRYTKYFEDTTNAKVDKKDKKNLNEVLRAVDKKNNEIVKQEHFDDYRELFKNENNVNTIDFLYNLCMRSKDPLEELENALCFLSCKYEGEGVIKNIGTIAKNIFKSKAKEAIVNKISDVIKIRIPKEEFSERHLLKMGLADVDDIKLSFKSLPLKEYPKTKYYRFLKLFKDEDLIAKSYSLDKKGKRKYKRARRLLDNILICLIKSITRVESKYLDEYPNDKQNILGNYLLALDENENGLTYENYSFLHSIKPFNISEVILSLLKSDKSYREYSLRKISDFMYDKEYKSYLKNTTSVDKIKDKFPTRSSLEYNMRLRSSYNIYKFYEALYTDNKKAEKEQLVCSGAKIRCTMSSTESKLLVISSKKYIDSKPCATIYDRMIEPFKECHANKVCVPTLGIWEKKKDISIGDKAALISNSKCLCTFGGVISITDPNQKTSNLKEISKIDHDIKYSLEDYKDIKNIYYDIENRYFNRFARYVYSSYLHVGRIDIHFIKLFREKLKPKYDDKKLYNENCIPVVDNDIECIVNIYPLAKIIMGYFYGRLNDNRIKDKWLDIGRNLSKELDFEKFISKAKKQLPVIYSAYKEKSSYYPKCTWMKDVYNEYMNRYSGQELNDRVRIYHKEGGGINGDMKTPWCASFVNFILKTGLKSPSSQCFYSKEGRKYFNKIKKGKFGAILVLNYGNGRGHCSFIVTEDDNGYLCLGGNQSKKIKKSYFPKNKRVQGIYWPK